MARDRLAAHERGLRYCGGWRLRRYLPGEIRFDERALENVDRVGLPDEAFCLVCAVWRLDAPQVDPDAVCLRCLDGGDHVLVASHEDRVRDGPVPCQRLHIGADLRVHALLLATGIEIAQAKLDPRHLRYDSLVDGGHPVTGGVIPVDPQELSADLIFGLPRQGLYQ